MANGWTPERKLKQAQAIRRWKPWEQSTGPRSVEGKQRASRRGWKGGVRHELRLLSRTLRQHSALLRVGVFACALLACSYPREVAAQTPAGGIVTVGELRAWCLPLDQIMNGGGGSPDEARRASKCLMYVVGAHDASAFAPLMGKTRLFCNPPTGGVTNEQLIAVFLAYANATPQEWDMPAIVGLFNASERAWDCIPEKRSGK